VIRSEISLIICKMLNMIHASADCASLMKGNGPKFSSLIIIICESEFALSLCGSLFISLALSLSLALCSDGGGGAQARKEEEVKLF
jgi:hypothetical protein